MEKKLKSFLYGSKLILKTGVGVALNIQDPTGFMGEMVKEGIDIAFTKLIDTFDERQLAEVEISRVKDTMVTSIEKIEENLLEGKTLREDGFFVDKIYDKTDAEEIFEAIIIAAQREPQYMKNIFYGNLLANIGFDNSISRDEAYQIIQISSKMSYRQCLLMRAIYINSISDSNGSHVKCLRDGHIKVNKNEDASYEDISLYQDAIELCRMGVVSEVNGRNPNYIGEVNMSNLLNVGIGRRITKLMGLDKIPDNKVWVEQYEKDYHKLMLMIEGDNVIYNDDGTSTITKVIY